MAKSKWIEALEALPVGEWTVKQASEYCGNRLAAQSMRMLRSCPEDCRLKMFDICETAPIFWNPAIYEKKDETADLFKGDEEIE